MRTTMASLALAFTLAAGCGGAQQPTTAGATCADAAANNERVILALGQQEGQDMAAMAIAGRDTFAERCAADGWSSAVVGCAARAADADAIQACVEALPPAQHQAMVDTFGAKMGVAPLEPAPTPSSAPAPGAPPPDDPCGGDE